MKNIDMTGGSIPKLLLRFAVPLFLGGLLQQLYSAFDAVVVGNYVGGDALAAVGASGPLINVIIAFFMGMSMGASVLISQAFGAGDGKDVYGVIHTAVPLAVVLGVALSATGIAITPSVLRMMKTPEQLMPGAIIYLRVYFSGLAAITVYNIGASILTAVGDTRRPLYFLTISTVLHIICNLLLVIVFHIGIAGVACSTVFSEFVAAVLVIATLCRTNGPNKLFLRSLRISMSYVKRIVNIGLPGGLQSAIISTSNLIVQSYINMLGADAVAGYSATSKLDAFIMLPIQTTAMTIATFVGQNLGAGQPARARKGVKTAMAGALAVTFAISAATLIFGRIFLRAFTPDEDIIVYGIRFLNVFAPLYFVLCFSQIIPGALRGAGDVRMAMFTCIGSFVGLRQIYLYVMTKIMYTPETVALSYPMTWAIAGAILTIYYAKRDWSKFDQQGRQQKQ